MTHATPKSASANLKGRGQPALVKSLSNVGVVMTPSSSSSDPAGFQSSNPLHATASRETPRPGYFLAATPSVGEELIAKLNGEARPSKLDIVAIPHPVQALSTPLNGREQLPSNMATGEDDDEDALADAATIAAAAAEDDAEGTGSARRKKSNWTEEQDKHLIAQVRIFSAKSWRKIAETFGRDENDNPIKTDTQCLHRWQKVINPDLKKGKWAPEEDTVLRQMVEKYGVGKWSVIAQALPGRIGKQARERWFNHLSDTVTKTKWSPDEDAKIRELYSEMGPKWSQIAKHFPGRSDNAVKNHYNSSIKEKTPKSSAKKSKKLPSSSSSSAAPGDFSGSSGGEGQMDGFTTPRRKGFPTFDDDDEGESGMRDVMEADENNDMLRMRQLQFDKTTTLKKATNRKPRVPKAAVPMNGEVAPSLHSQESVKPSARKRLAAGSGSSSRVKKPRGARPAAEIAREGAPLAPLQLTASPAQGMITLTSPGPRQIHHLLSVDDDVSNRSTLYHHSLHSHLPSASPDGCASLLDFGGVSHALIPHFLQAPNSSTASHRAVSRSGFYSPASTMPEFGSTPQIMGGANLSGSVLPYGSDPYPVYSPLTLGAHHHHDLRTTTPSMSSPRPTQRHHLQMASRHSAANSPDRTYFVRPPPSAYPTSASVSALSQSHHHQHSSLAGMSPLTPHQTRGMMEDATGVESMTLTSSPIPSTTSHIGSARLDGMVMAERRGVSSPDPSSVRRRGHSGSMLDELEVQSPGVLARARSHPRTPSSAHPEASRSLKAEYQVAELTAGSPI